MAGVGDTFPSRSPYKWSKLDTDDELAVQQCYPLDQRSHSTPTDVPRGHLVVYVGPDQKRFVIKVAYLKHPLFQALLDLAREEYEFCSHDSRLCIPCDEKIFQNVVGNIRQQQQNKKVWLCF